MPKEVTVSELMEFMQTHVLTKEDAKLFVTKEDLGVFAKKDDLFQFATKDDLRQLPTKDDLFEFAKKDDLGHFAMKGDIESLHGDLRMLDERLQRIEVNVKSLRKTVFEDVHALTKTVLDIDRRVRILEKK